MQDIIKEHPYDGPGKLSGSMHAHGGHYELSVSDRFEAAHALMGDEGSARYLHGHTWEVSVTLAGQQLDHVGMLYDVQAIKDHLRLVLNNFDHQCLNQVLPFDALNPTAEHLARIVFYELEQLLPSHIALKEVSISIGANMKLTYKP